ncbi:PAS domain S-box protein [Phenylobacterium sp.]|uniref:PAS domain S-box protein n=1 Tax=Phenylobacterium sp. TaxID=1871053 RepID=UPI0027337EBC|nr:PAS domain S-box protein [Phenylobacterium sp.]MDP3853103.1 PAS domain S-box protein [Phenylobacterium sp.]
MPDSIDSDRSSSVEALYWLLAEHTTDIIVRAGMDGALLYVSPSCRVMGYRPEELIGQPFAPLVHPDDQARFAANTAALFSGEPIDQAADRVIRYRAKGGQWIWLEGNPQLIRDETGRTVEILNAFRDVSARKHAELALEQAHARERRQADRVALAIDAAEVGIWELDLAAGALVWDARMYELYGWPMDEAPPTYALFESTLHPDDRERVLSERRAAMAGQADFDSDFRIIARGGAIRHLRARANLVLGPDGAPLSVVGVNWDITATRVLEASLRASETRMRNVIDNANEAIVSFDQAGLIIGWNGHAEVIFGWTAAEALGTSVAALIIPARDHPALRERLAGFLGRNDGSFVDRRLELTALRKTGEEFAIELAASAVADEKGWEVTALMHDISARRAGEAALAESEARYRLLTANATDIISCYGPDAVFRFLSPSLASVMGYEPHELVGKTATVFMHPDDVVPTLHRFAAHVAAGRDADPIRFKYRAYRKDGRMVWLEAQAKAIYDDDGVLVEFQDVVRDVTAGVALDDELRAARDAAEVAAAVKSDFMANMSHEIRTPLTAILGFTKLLSGREDLDAVAATQVQRVAGASQALLSIVNDILDFSKLEAGQVEIASRPVDPAQVLREALLLLSPQADAKGLALHFADENLPDCVRIDPDRVRQVLLNLIGNAVKFTETGGVRLVAAYDDEIQQLTVRIEDTGAGLGEAAQRKLFQRFSQVDASSTRRHGGTGLGLAICKGLVEAMGGAIGVSSIPGEGSCFFFSLDAPRAEAVGRPDPDAADTPSLDGVRILVVDDNAMNRELARAILGHIGAEVSEAADGLAAVEAAQALPYDVILLDIRMPGLDGPATLARIRGEPGPNQDVPILAFSADADLERFATQGFDGVVAKPLDAAALVGAIALALQWDIEDLTDADARVA